MVDVKRQAQQSALRASLQAERSVVAAQPRPLEARFAQADALAAATSPSTSESTTVVPAPSAEVRPVAPRGDEGLVLFDDIVARVGDLRPLRPSHVKDLAASIATVGLIQPPAVDLRNRLLAGEHRRAALELLRGLAGNLDAVSKEWPELEAEDHHRIADAWARLGFARGVPVRRMPFDAEQDKALALAVEATENEKRSDFSKEEIRGVVDKLKAAGYRASVGRPKKGEKALSPQLAIIFGKSQRQVFHYLADLRGDEKPKKKRQGRDAVAERFEELFGVPVVITRKRGGRGVVELSFSSEEQLEQLLGVATSMAESAE